MRQHSLHSLEAGLFGLRIHISGITPKITSFVHQWKCLGRCDQGNRHGGNDFSIGLPWLSMSVLLLVGEEICCAEALLWCFCCCCHRRKTGLPFCRGGCVFDCSAALLSWMHRVFCCRGGCVFECSVPHTSVDSKQCDDRSQLIQMQLPERHCVHF
jgi:hypothetical protein